MSLLVIEEGRMELMTSSDLNSYSASLKDVIIFEPKLFEDKRGCFYEVYNDFKYPFINQGIKFVQENISFSKKNTIRGLHFQKLRPQGKLVTCLKGEVIDILVDIRKSSKTYGKFLSISLNEINKKQVWVPPGFAHGFIVKSDEAVFFYKCTDFYDPSDEYGIAWNDKFLNIPWGINEPIISEKDSKLPSFKEAAVNFTS